MAYNLDIFKNINRLAFIKIELDSVTHLFLLYFSLQAPYESFTQGKQLDICVHVLLFFSPDDGYLTKTRHL